MLFMVIPHSNRNGGKFGFLDRIRVFLKKKIEYE
jgi:hypothetical protein